MFGQHGISHFASRFSGSRLAGLLAVCSLIGGLSSAHADSATKLPFDTPTMVDGMEAVCTGIGQDSRADPRWNAYPLKIVLAGEGGQYLGEADVNVAAEGETMMDVRCGGPWVLFNLESGRYTITAKINGNTATSVAYCRPRDKDASSCDFRRSVARSARSTNRQWNSLRFNDARCVVSVDMLQSRSAASCVDC